MIMINHIPLFLIWGKTNLLKRDIAQLFDHKTRLILIKNKQTIYTILAQCTAHVYIQCIYIVDVFKYLSSWYCLH